MSYYISALGYVSFEPKTNVKEIEKRFNDFLKPYPNNIYASSLGVLYISLSCFNWNSLDYFEDLLADIADKCVEGEIEFSADDGESWKYEFNSKTKKWEVYEGVKVYEFSCELKKEGEE